MTRGLPDVNEETGVEYNCIKIRESAVDVNRRLGGGRLGEVRRCGARLPTSLGSIERPVVVQKRDPVMTAREKRREFLIDVVEKTPASSPQPLREAPYISVEDT